jgi:hypothetical protein
LTTSYAPVNAFLLAVHPSKVSQALPLSDHDQPAWRDRFYDLITDSRLEEIIAFGGNAQAALRLWDNAPDVHTLPDPHPSAHDGADLAAKWTTAIADARGHPGPRRRPNRRACGILASGTVLPRGASHVPP